MTKVPSGSSICKLTGPARNFITLRASEQMATFLSRRDARETKREEKEEKKKLKLYYSDLLWAAKRRYLSDKELHDLYKLAPTYSNWGPERMEHELGELEKLREFFGRHQVGNQSPELNALQKHLGLHEERQQREEKELSKKIVYAHPSEKLLQK